MASGFCAKMGQNWTTYALYPPKGAKFCIAERNTFFPVQTLGHFWAKSTANLKFNLKKRTYTQVDVTKARADSPRQPPSYHFWSPWNNKRQKENSPPAQPPFGGSWNNIDPKCWLYELVVDTLSDSFSLCPNNDFFVIFGRSVLPAN